MNRRQLLVGTTAIALTLSALPVAHAQTPPGATPNSSSTGLAEVVVTAERRTQTIQKEPLTVTAVSGGDIARKAVSTYETLLQQVPGVQLQMLPSTDSPSPVIAIRGLGTDGGNKPPSTAVYEDGVIINNENLQFYDLSRVEVLSGPQATLYGGVATAGAVNVITNNPSFAGVSGAARLGYGTADLVHFDGMLNLPINDVLAARIAFDEERRNNYVSASGTGRQEFNGRVKLLYQPSDALSLLLGGEVYRFSGVLTDASYGEDTAGNILKPGIATVGSGFINTYKVYANLNWNIGPAVLTYIPAGQFEGQNLEFLNPPGANNIIDPYHNVVTQEIRLANEASAPVQWVAGFYFLHSAQAKIVNIGLTPALPVPAPTPGFGPLVFSQTIGEQELHPFAQATVPITSTLRFTGGISYSTDSINYPQTNLIFGSVSSTVFDKTYHSLDGLARIEADVTPRNLVYASFSTGYRPGGPAPAGGAGYQEETVKAYEIGSKNRFFDDRLQANLDFYYNDYPNFQNDAAIYLPDGFILSTTTSVPATFYGTELSIVARLTPNDTLTFDPAWESAHYSGNAVQQLYPTGTAVLTTNGGPVPHAPAWSINGEYDHTIPLPNGDSVLLSADAHYETKQPVTFDSCLYSAAACAGEGETVAELTQKAYVLADAEVTYTFPDNKYSIGVYGHNLTNLLYKGGYGQGYVTTNAPRTVGVQVSAKW